MPAAPKVSFEFFPPKTLDASFRLWESVRALAPFEPEFVSVTYGAGGTTRTRTHEAVEAIGGHYGLDVAAHLTCVDASKQETLDIAAAYSKAGVKRLVALRGDPSDPEAGFAAREDGFSNSVDLVRALAGTGRFDDIIVGAYPDPHPEAASPAQNVEWLKRKIDAGATGAITQFFFEADTFFRFRDACAAAGIDAPILPGILPIQSWSGTKKFATRCGAIIPAWLEAAFETAERDNRTDLLAFAVATELCTKLIEGGVDHLHFYTLNRPDQTRDILRALGCETKAELAEVA